VTAKQNREPTRCGYLCKYRPFTTGLFSGQWELRFFTLNGSALQYYRSEKAVADHPRGHVDVAVRTPLAPPPARLCSLLAALGGLARCWRSSRSCAVFQVAVAPRGGLVMRAAAALMFSYTGVHCLRTTKLKTLPPASVGRAITLTASRSKLARCVSHAGAISYVRTFERRRRAQGCIVEVEGLKKERFWTFGVVDRGGISLMRLSTADGQAADAWVQALAAAGCELRTLSGPCRMRSPLRSADVRWVRAAARAPPSAAGRAGRRVPAPRAVLPGPTDSNAHGRPSVSRAHQRAASAGSLDRPPPCTGASAAPHPRRPVLNQHSRAVIEQANESAAGAAEGGRATAAGAAGAPHHPRPGPGPAVEQRRGPWCAPRQRPALAHTSCNALRHRNHRRACWSMRQAFVWRLRLLGLRLARKEQDRLRALRSRKTHASHHSADQQCLAHAFADPSSSACIRRRSPRRRRRRRRARV